VLRYKVEPYVVAADVYSVPPHVGRGGWLYRAGIESILGLRFKGDSMEIDPCIPVSWRGFEMTLRYAGAVYEISIHNPSGVSRGVVAAELDGTSYRPSRGKVRLKLATDRGTHSASVTLGIAAVE
jgi:cyclic beta-1,2-glucan synthetase